MKRSLFQNQDWGNGKWKKQPSWKRILRAKAVLLFQISTPENFFTNCMRKLPQYWKKILVQRWISTYGEWKKTWLKRWVSSCLDETVISNVGSTYYSTVSNMWKLHYKRFSFLIKGHGRVFECISLYAWHRKHISQHLYKIQTV